jgi:hypothetical protein
MNRCSDMKRILAISEGDYWSDFRDALLDCLSERGWRIELSGRLPTSRNIDLPLLVFGIHHYPELIRKSFKHAVGIQTEQLALVPDRISGRGHSNRRRILSLATHYDLVFEWSAHAFSSIHRGTNIRLLPYGFGALPDNGDPEPDYDAVFIGCVDDPRGRRRRLLKAVASSCKLYPHHEGLWGGARNRAIRSSKIVLNIHFDESPAYESPRFADAVANCRLFLTEPLSDSFPYVEGRDYAVFRDEEQLLANLGHYLRNPDERQRVIESAVHAGGRYNRDVLLPMAALDIERAFSAPPKSLWHRSLLKLRSESHFGSRFCANLGSRLRRCIAIPGRHGESPGGSNLDH